MCVDSPWFCKHSFFFYWLYLFEIIFYLFYSYPKHVLVAVFHDFPFDVLEHHALGDVFDIV